MAIKQLNDLSVDGNATLISGKLFLTANNYAIENVGGNYGVRNSSGNYGGNDGTSAYTTPQDFFHIPGNLRVGPKYATSDRDYIKLIPSGSTSTIEMPNENAYIHNNAGNIVLRTGSSTDAVIVSGSDTTFAGNLYLNNVDTNTNSENTILVLNGSTNKVEKRELPADSGAFQEIDVSAGQVAFGDGTGLNGDGHLYWDSTNNRLGIGTTSPAADLHIEDAGNSSSGIRIEAVGSANTDTVNMHFQGQAGSAPFYISRASTGGAEIQIQADGDLILNGTNGDNVGIGTTNPQQKLDVNGNASLRGNVYFGTGTSNYYNGVGGGFAVYTQGNQKRFEVRYGGDTTAKTLTLGDRFDTAARAGNKLDVAGDIYGTNNTSSVIRFDNTESSVSSTGGEVLQIRHDGASGTGTGALMITFRDLSGGIKGKISSNGTSTSYGGSSDQRLKEDEKDFNGLDLVSNMQAYDFKWKNYNLREYGMFAQELKEIAPQAVEWDDNNEEDIMCVDYSKIVPILVKAIQELEAKVKVLENK